MNRKVGTIHLNEQDSKNFTRAFWCPTHEEIEENKKITRDKTTCGN